MAGRPMVALLVIRANLRRGASAVVGRCADIAIVPADDCRGASTGTCHPMLPPLPEVAGVDHRYANVSGVRLHYAEAGAGDPVVLLHGWPQHWWMWRDHIGPLAERFRVIVPDLRGHGWSGKPRSSYRKTEMLADVLGLLDRLGLERVRLVGHDWGGWVGMLAG